ncbi:MAG: hypothetical protein EBZ48_09305 [Proteobacteria bacterium]|nr:hypothetical protein [Pseudomonadota bacterium]
MPDLVVIFTEELSSHVPFFYVERLGASPGELLKDSLVQIGIPKSRVIVVRNPEELVFSESDSGDAFLDVLGSRSVVFLGDRHVLDPGWIQNGLKEALSITLREQLLMLERQVFAGKKTPLHNPRECSDAEMEREMVAALESVLVRFSAISDPHKRRQRVAWLRMPLENFLMDLSTHEMLDPGNELKPEELVPVVRREVLEILRAQRG